MRIHLESEQESILLASRFGRASAIVRKVGASTGRASVKIGKATGRGVRRTGGVLRGRYGRLSPMAKARLQGAGAGLAIAGTLRAARSFAKSSEKKNRSKNKPRKR